MSTPADAIVCLECGGTAHLMSFLPEADPLEPGQPIAYQCSECDERYDLVWEGDEDDRAGG